MTLIASCYYAGGSSLNVIFGVYCAKLINDLDPIQSSVVKDKVWKVLDKTIAVAFCVIPVCSSL